MAKTELLLRDKAPIPEVKEEFPVCTCRKALGGMEGEVAPACNESGLKPIGLYGGINEKVAHAS